MTFDDLPSGTSIFLDANPLVYHFASDPALGPACARLLTRIMNQEFQAYLSTHVAVMQAHGLTHLASHDGDFDRVPGLTRYAPA